ncbi:signal recognition particle receptor FtsY [Candidatus Tachikawaea gelatinosa]|uniref:Signal recognition particle receptor FtsY n=1 Tax=Candidatus Tachikawaea gelatinosa TaxID=1410383 RepID=A0A090ALG2_9ENTR|nr:signal recognition particle receptor FtsY [Candidatus Tachikawaea gelatinosa]
MKKEKKNYFFDLFNFKKKNKENLQHVNFNEEKNQTLKKNIFALDKSQKKTNDGFFYRLKKSLLKTSKNIGSGLKKLFFNRKIDDALFEELEEQLLIADVGINTTNKILKNITKKLSKKELDNAEIVYSLLKKEMISILEKVEKPIKISKKNPFIIIIIGVNGSGKTTTIGKLAHYYQSLNKSVILAAGDTFRAAAKEQLEVWGKRNNILVVKKNDCRDSAAVIFEAIQIAKKKKSDILIADTSGRIHNNNSLMKELEKIICVIKKIDPNAPHEVMLTIDANNGQNSIIQAKIFKEKIGVNGIILTKLDGTAKGGVIFSIAENFNIPIRYIGIGEKINDLRSFNAKDFVNALFN